MQILNMDWYYAQNQITMTSCSMLALGIFACKKEYIAPASTDFSDPAVSSSGTKTLEQGDTTSFVDLSKGVTNRTWAIPNGPNIINLEVEINLS